MEKQKSYQDIRFSPDVLQEASQEFRSRVDPEKKSQPEYSLSVEVEDAEWTHDSLEEFFADYRRSSGQAIYQEHLDYKFKLDLFFFSNSRRTQVSVTASDRSTIEAVFEVFERHIDVSRLPSDPPQNKPQIFIGHGHSPLWRELKDHLQDKHGYDVIAYEVGARAGHAVRDILEEMIEQSTFAILVMTGEDETKKNKLRPRLNVAHELGLFQGSLGFSRAIALLEKNTEELSNIHGVHQIRFSKGNIKETFGDILATLNREFPQEDS